MDPNEWKQFPELAMLHDLTEQQRIVFLVQYHAVRKDVVTGVLFSALLGHFGAHRFYMGETGLGLLYLLFCWTGIPTILGIVEAFLMPGRVRRYNVEHAITVAAQVKVMPFGSAAVL